MGKEQSTTLAEERADIAAELREMAKANRMQAETLMLEADRLDRAAQILDAPAPRPQYDTVDPAELSDEIRDSPNGSAVDLDEAISAAKAHAEKATAATARPLRAVDDPPPRSTKAEKLRWTDRIAELLARERGQPVKMRDVIKELGIRANTAGGALKELVERRIAVRIGGERGPGVAWVIAKVPPFEPDRPDESSAHAALPPAPVGEPQRPKPVEAIATAPTAIHQTTAGPNKCAIAIQCLIERGDRGMKPSQLRGETGLVPQQFEGMMNVLIDRGIVARMPADDGIGKIFVLKKVGAELKAALDKIAINI